jgi:hypothetical protein
MNKEPTFSYDKEADVLYTPSLNETVPIAYVEKPAAASSFYTSQAPI